MKKMKLSEKLSIDSVDYASQGNAILGIRGSGKSYTATFLAERLMDDHIPIIAFDPIGIWRSLKIGKDGPGYPVVVAGDDGDLPLTAESAPDIVRAAMQQNVSLVVDLYSMHLSKKDWRTIVEKCIRLLLYENKPCGLRHIFIEEAAEFCPQRIQAEEGKVYAEIEKLARMGGNASLGYTLINQRPEEVNKAVLELCDTLFLHRQKGRHSLTALSKWLDVASTKNAEKVMGSLPSLEPGQCWVWTEGSHSPEFVAIPEKVTIHPDRKNPLGAAKGTISPYIDDFVSLMKRSMAEKAVEPSKNGRLPRIIDQSDEAAHLRKLLRAKENRIKQLEDALRGADQLFSRVRQWIPDDTLLPAEENPGDVLSERIPPSVTEARSENVSKTGIGGGAMRMLKAVAMVHPFKMSKARIATLARMSPKSGSFNTHMATLKREGWILQDGGAFFATAAGIAKAGHVEPLPSDPEQLIELWCDVIGNGSGAARILRTLAKKYPKEMDRNGIAQQTGMSSTSGSFNTYVATLKRNGLITANGKMLKAADELYANI